MNLTKLRIEEPLHPVAKPFSTHKCGLNITKLPIFKFKTDAKPPASSSDAELAVEQLWRDSNGVFKFADTQFDAEKKSAQRRRKSQRFPYKTIFSGPFPYSN